MRAANVGVFSEGSFNPYNAFFFAKLLAVVGLVLGPYFGLASLISRENSVWVEANRMIHEYISIPIVGGVFLLFFQTGFYSDVGFTLIPVYVLFVFLATGIPVMAARTGKGHGSSHVQ